MPATGNTIEKVRTALKFSLWAWAAYWPAMGIMLLLGGMGDPVSVAVVVLSGGAFALLALGGALRATASRDVREFLIERPFYLVAGLILVLLASTAVPEVANFGLAIFSGIFLGSLLFLAWRLAAHVEASGLGVFGSRADQLFLLLLVTVPCAALVFFDGLPGDGAGNPAPSVALVNWLCLSYPALLLLASRPLREPLQLTVWKPKGSSVGGKPAPAQASPVEESR